MILSTFTDSTRMAEFLSATNLTTDSSNSVEISLHMAKLARHFGGELTQTDFSNYQYIVKTDSPSTIVTTSTLVTSIGSTGHLPVGDVNFYVVESQYGLSLYDELDGVVDQANTPVKLMSQITGNEILADALPADYQWGRLRIISRNRPFATAWNLAEVNFNKKPNLVVVDSGINFSHIEFQGIDTEDLFALPKFNGNFRDDAGHGTGVASYAAGANIGVHRHLKLLNCKIFDASTKPTLLELVQALDVVYDKFVSDPSVPMVVNLSWVVNKNNYLEAKIQNMINAGIGIVCGAGNSDMDTSLLTPAGMTDVITVAASDKDDVSAGFNNFSEADKAITTNYGLNIDIFAPGVDCFGAGFQNDNTYISHSGTSISAGYISGCVAAILALVPGTYFADAKRILLDYATKGSLLIDFDHFTFAQNQLPYLVTADDPMSFDSSAYYLGYVNNTTDLEIIGNINQVVSVTRYTADVGETFTYQIVCDDSIIKTALDACISLTNEGDFTITNPSLEWGVDERIRMINFKIHAVSNTGSIKFKSPNLLFFATNPDVVESLTGDISTALENIDSQSFFATWAPGQVIK